MQLDIIGEFHARPGAESAVEAAIRTVVPQTRAEATCLHVHGFRCTRDPARFFIHSRWRDAAAFEAHVLLPHTVQFLATIAPLLTHEVEVARVSEIA